MANQAKEATHKPPAKPNTDLMSLDRMIGTWKVTGGIEGTQTFERTEGGFFIIHHFDFDQGGQKMKGMEVIGHQQQPGGEPTAEIKSRLYSFLDGMSIDYVFEAQGDTFTYWMGPKGSPSYMKGEFSADGKTYNGEWVWPGGGYKLTGTKVE